MSDDYSDCDWEKELNNGTPTARWLQLNNYDSLAQSQRSRERFFWVDGDVTWHDNDGKPMTAEEVATVQAEQAEAIRNGTATNVILPDGARLCDQKAPE